MERDWEPGRRVEGRRRAARAALGVALAAAFVAAPAAPAQDALRVTRAASNQTIAVPLDQAIVVESRTPFAEVSIAQPGIADVQPLSDTSVYVLGRGRGRTTLTLIGPDGALISNATLVVEPDVGELKARLAALLPGEPVEVRAAGAGVALSGVVSDAETVERAVTLARAYAGEDVANLLSVGGANQVSLRVRIAEVNRTAAKQLGLGLGVARGGDPTLRGGTDGIRPEIVGDTAVFNVPAPTGFGFLDAIFSVGESLFLDVSIDALERRGFARTLAEPNLVAISGGSAEFLAGGEAPIPLITEDEIKVEFRPVGVRMDFLPVVLANDRISVTVAAEVSSVDPSLGVSVGEIEIPGFTTRRASTVVELEDGQSFAIAGLYQDDFADTIRQIPWLGELPVIGALFRSVEFQRGETELVVIVTAHLVAPVEDASRLATPLEAALPSERELFLLGGAEGGRTARLAVPDPGFDGEWGYVLD